MCVCVCVCVCASRLNDLVKGFFLELAHSAVKNGMAETIEWKSYTESLSFPQFSPVYWLFIVSAAHGCGGTHRCQLF